jgi:hypothetical protein
MGLGEWLEVARSSKPLETARNHSKPLEQNRSESLRSIFVVCTAKQRVGNYSEMYEYEYECERE